MNFVFLTFRESLLTASQSLTFANSKLIEDDMWFFVRFEILVLIKLFRDVSSANRIKSKYEPDCGMSFMYIRKSSGPKMDPWGTPVLIGNNEDFTLLSSTY